MSTMSEPIMSMISPIDLTKKGAKLVTIWPALAQWLLQFNTLNRSPRRFWVKELAHRMKNGEFSTTNATIGFSLDWKWSESGGLVPVVTLVDGQHRLMAIAESGVSVETYVVTGLEPEHTFGKIDVGQSRNGADWLTVRGEKNTSALSAAISWSWRYCNGTMMTGGTISESQQKTHLDQHAGLRDAVIVAKRMPNLARSVGLTAALYYHCAQFDASKAEHFFKNFSSGTGLELGAPIHTLWKTFAKRTSGTSRISTWYKAALIIKAWNAYRSGQTLKQLKMTTEGESAEGFPEIL